MKNYWRMRDFSIFSVPYAYVDHRSYQADQLFVQNKVKMNFKGECAKVESPYRIVFCKVRKKDKQKNRKIGREFRDGFDADFICYYREGVQ